MPITSKIVKGNRTSDKSKHKEGWELALERAKSALYKNKVYRIRLTAAIRLFQDNIRRGEPWPEKEYGKIKKG